MDRYLKTYRSIFKMNVKALMIYEADFIVGVIAMIFKTLINFSILLVLFNKIDNIRAWNFDEMLFLYGFSTTSFALWHCFFINTITIPIYIKTGELDRFLLMPQNPLFLIISEGFDEDGWGELLLAVVISVIAIIRLEISGAILILLPLLYFASSFIYAGISIFLSCFAFFTVENTDLTDLTMNLNEFAKYPIDIYSKFLKIIFSFVLPIGFASYFPSLIFLRGVNSFNILMLIATFVVSIGFLVIAFKFWMLCLKKYISAGT